MTRRLAIGLCLGLLGCEPPAYPPPFEGSCPVLIECAAELRAPEADLFNEAFGADGTCWSSGPNYYQQCRDSCVAALGSVNEVSLAEGKSCGSCDSDADCQRFGADARCELGWCAQRKATADSGDDEGETEAGDSGDGDGDLGDQIDAACIVDDTPLVVLETNYGAMTFELDRLAAPVAVDVFLRYLSGNFYDYTLIHRIVDGLLIQGGGYSSGPLLKQPVTSFELSSLPALGHGDGALAMVFKASQGTIASQWYITDGAQPSLDESGAVIGVLVAGAAVRDQISALPVGIVTLPDYTLPSFPDDEVVVEQAYCIETL